MGLVQPPVVLLDPVGDHLQQPRFLHPVQPGVVTVVRGPSGPPQALLQVIQIALGYSDGELLCFVDGYVRETFAVHVDRTLRLIHGLKTAGIHRGDRIAIIADSSRHVINLFHAAALGGFIAVPFNMRLGPMELAQMLADCDPAVIAVDDRHLDAALAAVTQAQLSAVVLACARRLPRRQLPESPA